MIIEMARIRVMGPRALLGATVRAIQDEGLVQLADAAYPPGLASRALDPVVRRRRHHLGHALARVDQAVAELALLGAAVAERSGGAAPSDGQAARVAARVLAEAMRLSARERALTEERDALRLYEPLFADLEALFAAQAARRVSIYLLRLRSQAALGELRDALARTLHGDHELRSHVAKNGETVVLLLVPTARGDEIERQLAAARVEQAALPSALGSTLADALPRMRPRLAEVTRELADIRGDAAALARAHGDALVRGRRVLHDSLLALDAEERAAISARVFVLEGWLPARDRLRLAEALGRKVGPEVTIEEIARHDWAGADAPVVLHNPRVFAPFEILTSLLPLPRYGSVDPTPFVAVFFPMLFGVIVGDVGYGFVMVALAVLLRVLGRRSKVARDVAKIAAAVAVYTILFGLAYGEAFGDLGARFAGMHALWFDRQEAVLAFLVLAIALGAVHLIIGLVVAAASRWRRDRRAAVGRGVTAAMLILLAVTLLALFEQLPGVLLTPAVIALLVAFAVVIVLEGATAILEFMSVVNHVLSYARVMALGTASVMLAIVANRMQGAFGSLALGIAFALVFHLINFAITLFSPTIHVMRLHYVEFFETFFEPGGGPYRPLRHWSGPEPAPP